VATIAEVFSLAWKYHQAGGLAQAEQLYRQVLGADPRHADAWCFLGAACQAQGRIAEAETNYRRAVQVIPGHTSALNCLGVLLAEQGKLAEAVVSFQKALDFDPRSAEIHNNLGLALSRLGQTDKAVATYCQALRLRPGYAQAHYNFGLTLNGMGQRAAAVEQFQEALRCEPNYPEAYNDLANALAGQDKLDDAVTCYREALRLRPNYAEAYYNLGVVLGKQNKHLEALAQYDRAVYFKPEYVEAHVNRGNVRHAQWKFDEAIECYQQALHYKPDSVDALHGLGGVYLRQGRLEQAMANFQQALRIQPDLAAVHSNVLFCLNYDPNADPEEVFAAHRRWGQLQEAASSSTTVHANERDPDRRLRIGYVSPDLRYHALARYLEPVLAHHDPQQVEVFCYAEVQFPDAVTARLQKLLQGWRSTCELTDAAVAELIRQDKIDILVDLAGHTAGNRLRAFAEKPAPVQATWLGYMNTTGLTAVDYRLTDPVLDPPGQPVRDTEELFRLQGGLCCFAPPTDAPEVAPLPALRRGHLTFGSLHNLFKLNAQVFDLWSRLLKAVPSARLLLFRHTLTGTAREEIRQKFADRGIAGERLDLRQGSDAAGYLKIYEEIDIGLDTFPYTGGVTTCESLWMGVPVLSLCGVRPAGRNSAAILARAGLGDWAAQKPEEYLEVGQRWSNDLDRLAALRTGLRETVAKTLCDAGSFTRMLEEAYRTMWRRWCSEGGMGNPA
jgi:protein O-GlcNAc transferase